MTATSASQGADAGPIEGIVLILPSFLAIMGAIVLVPVLPQIAKDYAGTPHLPFLIQTILTVPSLMVVLFSPVAGILGDRLGRKRLLVGAMLIYAVMGLCPMVLGSIYAVLASRVLLGIVEAAVLTLATTLLGDAFSGNARNRWFGYQIGGGALIAIPMLSASGHLGQFGWRLSFLIYSLPLLMVFLVLFIARERTAAATPDWNDDDAAVTTGFPWRHMTIVGAISLFASICFFALQLQQGLALNEVGAVSPERIGNLTALASIGAPVGTILFRFIAHRTSAFLLSCGFCGAAAGLLGVAWATTPAGTVAAIFVGLIGSNIILPTMLSWTASGLHQGNRARGIGIWQGLFAVGQFVSAIAFGWSMSVLGSAKMAFALIGAGVGLAAAITIALGAIRWADRERAMP
ncbi:MFS transporter [Sphingomonas sp. 2SG]|uniref:MFS transporter n=1 Tax=Sphingomonas sp. 2SG TaxID=2502201 RepID=UPI0014856D8F|nr:MFS transporter [Sphingomonas sp. 2SG]